MKLNKENGAQAQSAQNTKKRCTTFGNWFTVKKIKVWYRSQVKIKFGKTQKCIISKARVIKLFNCYSQWRELYMPYFPEILRHKLIMSRQLLFN